YKRHIACLGGLEASLSTSGGEYKTLSCYTFFCPQLPDLAMKLIGSLTSPYVRKVRVVMAEKKLEYDFVVEDVWAQDTSIQIHNPLGKVPCLLMDDNGSLFDSRVIVEYLDTLSPVGRLIPQQG